MSAASACERPVRAVAVAGARPAASADDHGARGARTAAVADSQGRGRRKAGAAFEVENRAIRTHAGRAIASGQEEALAKAFAAIRQEQPRRPVRAAGTSALVVASAEPDRFAAH